MDGFRGDVEVIGASGLAVVEAGCSVEGAGSAGPRVGEFACELGHLEGSCMFVSISTSTG